MDFISVWTFACFPTASTSNLTRFFVPFGLLLWLSPLQRPIWHVFSFRLDFCLLSHCFNVQSDMFSSPFWTSSVTFSTSTSNPPRRLTINHLQPHKCLHYNSALIISAALTIFLRLASVSGTHLVLSPQSGFTHNSVSYTHLDVYKRQALLCSIFCLLLILVS